LKGFVVVIGTVSALPTSAAELRKRNPEELPIGSHHLLPRGRKLTAGGVQLPSTIAGSGQYARMNNEKSAPSGEGSQFARCAGSLGSFDCT
jgi:hypothetical protein